MSPEVAILAEKAAAVARHLKRVEECLPATAEGLRPMTDPSDAVILHLWQAVQIVIDMAVSLCVRLGLGAPASYGEAFRKLAAAGVIDAALANRLTSAAGFRNVVAHAYEAIDMTRVFLAATQGPPDLRAFLAASTKLAETTLEKK